MEVIENTTIYKCNFCPRYLRKKHAMIKHEDLCIYNPKNHSACSSCKFLKEVEGSYEMRHPEHGGNFTMTTKAFVCEKFGKKLYPFKVIRKGLLEKYPETFEGQELMPNKCSEFKFL